MLPSSTQYVVVLCLALVTLTMACGKRRHVSDTKKEGNSTDMTVLTGCIQLGGTDSEITIQIHGDKGLTNWALLDNPGCDDFEQCNADNFNPYFNTDFGVPDYVQLNSDHAGPEPGWYPTKVIVEDQYVFECNQWLDKDTPTIMCKP